MGVVGGLIALLTWEQDKVAETKGGGGGGGGGDGVMSLRDELEEKWSGLL